MALKGMCVEGRSMFWWSNVLYYGDGAWQVSTRELDPHVFPNEVDWTIRHAVSGAYAREPASRTKQP